MGRRRKGGKSIYHVDDLVNRRTVQLTHDEYLARHAPAAGQSATVNKSKCKADVHEVPYPGCWNEGMRSEALSPRDAILLHLSSKMRLIWCTADSKEGHFVQQAYDIDSGRPCQRKYFFVGMRSIKCANGHQITSWCNHPECPDKEQCRGRAVYLQESEHSVPTSNLQRADAPKPCPFSRWAVAAACDGRSLSAHTLEELLAKHCGKKVRISLWWTHLIKGYGRLLGCKAWRWSRSGSHRLNHAIIVDDNWQQLSGSPSVRLFRDTDVQIVIQAFINRPCKAVDMVPN